MFKNNNIKLKMIYKQKVYTPLLLYIYKSKKYFTKIIKFDDELTIKDFKTIDVFRRKIEQGKLFEENIFLYIRSQNGNEVFS